MSREHGNGYTPNLVCHMLSVETQTSGVTHTPPFICSALGWQAHPSLPFLPSLQDLKNTRFSLPRFKAALSLTTLHHACWIGLLVRVQVVEWLQEVGPWRGSRQGLYYWWRRSAMDRPPPSLVANPLSFFSVGFFLIGELPHEVELTDIGTTRVLGLPPSQVRTQPNISPSFFGHAPLSISQGDTTVAQTNRQRVAWRDGLGATATLPFGASHASWVSWC
jgi:hypothetical protein